MYLWSRACWCWRLLSSNGTEDCCAVTGKRKNQMILFGIRKSGPTRTPYRHNHEEEASVPWKPGQTWKEDNKSSPNGNARDSDVAEDLWECGKMKSRIGLDVESKTTAHLRKTVLLWNSTIKDWVRQQKWYGATMLQRLLENGKLKIL